MTRTVSPARVQVLKPNSAPTALSTLGPVTGSEAVGEWLSGGARLVGGCCRVGPAEIQAIRDLAARHH